MEKKEILTVIAKNRNSFAWASTSQDYIHNVILRLKEHFKETNGHFREVKNTKEATLKEKHPKKKHSNQSNDHLPEKHSKESNDHLPEKHPKQSNGYFKENIIDQLYDLGYFFHRDPLLPCACVLLQGLSAKTVVQYVTEAVPQAKITILAVDQERKRIEAVINPSKNQVPPTPRAQKRAQAKKEKEEKIRKAVTMYTQKATDQTQYSTDYESILIENLLKQGISPDTIRNLTKKGMEYYAEFG